MGVMKVASPPVLIQWGFLVKRHHLVHTGGNPSSKMVTAGMNAPHLENKNKKISLIGFFIWNICFYLYTD